MPGPHAEPLGAAELCDAPLECTHYTWALWTAPEQSAQL
jgi:hypothetical protein